MKTGSLLLSVLAGVVITGSVACSGGGGGGGGGGTTNKFKLASRAMTNADLAPAGALAGTTNYSGSFLAKDGSGAVYSGVVTFSLQNDGVNVSFSSFSLRSVQLHTSYEASTELAAGPLNCTLDGTNSISIANATSRLVQTSLEISNTGACSTIMLDLTNLKVLFSNDFSTFVGGDDNSFFWIAQKTNSTPVYTTSDANGNYEMLWFTISGTGELSETADMSENVTVTTGAWTGKTAAGETTNGTLKSAASSNGGYLFKYAGSSSIDGGFILAPDKKFILGIDLTEGVYFASSK